MEKIRTICIIQARFGATRLPGKVLMKVGGVSLLERVVNRVKPAKLVDKIVVATTDEKKDDKIAAFCRRRNIAFFRGSENDVLDRFYQCALRYPGYGAIARITADCPLIDSKIIDKVIKLFFQKNADYASNVIPPTFPDGLDVEVFSFDVLEKMWKNATKQHEREHVTAHVRDNPQKFKIANLSNKKDLSKIRLTVDYKEDIKFIEHLLKLLPKNFRSKEIMKALDKNTGLADINKKYGRHDGYDSWRKHCENFNK